MRVTINVMRRMALRKPRYVAIALLWPALMLVSARFAVAQSPPVASPPRVERPMYHVGHRWILNHGTYDLTRIDKDTYVFTAAGKREIQLSKDLGIARVVRNGRIEVDFDPAPVAKWPPSVGDWGTT